jgi:thiamine biosynthesis lipoprotein
MDTVVRIAVYDPKMSRSGAEVAIDQAFKRMAEVEAKVSSHITGNKISALNAQAGDDFLSVSDETRLLLKTSRKIGDETGGAFDVAIGLIKNLWSFDSETPSVPDSASIRKRLPLIDYRQIEIRDHHARLMRLGMAIDLGGIAKGLIIDRAVESLQSSGVRAGLVDAGGDIRIFGQHPTNTHWRIGVKHPRPNKKSLYAVIETDATSIATSGDYERFFIINDRRYHHILDPKTGYPATGCVSVTVVAESAMIADAYATAVFVLGPDAGMKLIERLPEIEGMILFEKDGHLERRTSRGLISKVQLL